MGVFSELASGNFEQIYEILNQHRIERYKELENKVLDSWGSRKEILRIGKYPQDMVFHEGKPIASARQQVQLLYNWIPIVRDRKTRRIGKHWFKEKLVIRKSILEEYEEWKKEKSANNISFFHGNEGKKKQWTYNFEALTEKEVLKLYREEEAKWKGIPDRVVKELEIDDSDQSDPWFSFIAGISKMVSTAEEQYQEFEKMSAEDKETILKDRRYHFTEKQLKQKKEKNLYNRFYTYHKALKIMKKITEGREMQYILTNPVYSTYQESKTNFGHRTLERLTEFHVLYCEVDQYSEKALQKYRKMTAQKVFRLIEKKLEKLGFPLPTEVVFSRGPQLWWKISPIPSYKMEEWKLMMKKIHNILKEFGADSKALDGVRILRAVGSIHEKTGKRISGITFSDDRYDFDTLFNLYCIKDWKKYLIEQEKKRQQLARKKKAHYQNVAAKHRKKQKWMFENGLIDENGQLTHKYDSKMKKSKKKLINYDAKKNIYNFWHKNIITGVFHLCKLRKGFMNGCREFSCFLVRYLTLCVSGGNEIEANHVMWELFHSFSANEYSWDEMLSFTQSAIDAYKRWEKNEQLGYNYSPETLIEKLNISPIEMKNMRFIVDEERKSELKRIYNREYKQRTGYNAKQYKNKLDAKNKQTKKEEKEICFKRIRNILQENPHTTQQEIADKLKVTTRTIRNYLKEMGL